MLVILLSIPRSFLYIRSMEIVVIFPPAYPLSFGHRTIEDSFES